MQTIEIETPLGKVTATRVHSKDAIPKWKIDAPWGERTPCSCSEENLRAYIANQVKRFAHHATAR